MGQFDLFRLQGGQLVVDLQTDLIGIEASRIVAPLREVGRYAALPGLTPSVEIDGVVWIVRVQELAAVPGAELGAPVGSLADHRDALKRAFRYPDRRYLTAFRAGNSHSTGPLPLSFLVHWWNLTH